MKIRTGFVSNSSSSSFILTNCDIIDLAKDMLIHQSKNYKNKLNDKLSKLAFFKRNKKKLETKYGKLGIFFNSCNYDTYIFKDIKTNRVIIQTCNNENYENLLNTSKKYHVLDSGDDIISNDDYTILKRNLYFDLSSKRKYLITSPSFTIKYYCKCPHKPIEINYKINIETDIGKFVCINCKQQINPQIDMQ